MGSEKTKSADTSKEVNMTKVSDMYTHHHFDRVTGSDYLKSNLDTLNPSKIHRLLLQIAL